MNLYNASSKPHYRVFTICSLVWCSISMNILIISFILPVIGKLWSLNELTIGLLGSAALIGMLIGGCIWGIIADRIGRKITLALTVLTYTIFQGLSGFSSEYLLLFIFRFLCGIGLGGAMPVCLTFLSEILPNETRGKWIGYFEVFWNVGIMIAAISALIMLQSLPPYVSWRYLLSIGAMYALLAPLVYFRLPESPRYVIAKDKANVKTAKHVSMLWEQKWRRNTIMLWILWFFTAWTFYGIFIWLPSYIMTVNILTSIHKWLNTYTYSILLSIALIFGCIFDAHIVDRIGRKLTLSICFISAAIFTAMFSTLTHPLILFASGILLSFFIGGSWAALIAYSPEQYPTDIRATGVGWASGVGRVASSVAPIFVGLLLPHWKFSGVLMTFALSSLICAIDVIILGKETKGKVL